MTTERIRTFIQPHDRLRKLTWDVVELISPIPGDLSTSEIQINNCTHGVFELIWEGLDGIDSTAILQGSPDGIYWNDLGGAAGGLILDNAEDIQQWEITKLTHRYLRLDYTANSVTAGELAWRWVGYA